MFSRIIRLTLITALSAPLFAADSKVTPEEEPLFYAFKSDEDGYNTYRIPAVVRSNKGTLIAFAEGRVNHSGDHGNIDLVCKRSADDGKTWSTLSVVQDDGNNTCGNPSPVVDESTGRIILLSCGSESGEGAIMAGKGTREIYVQHSDDDGVTWSPRRDITSQARPGNWRWYATGPCSGIQIKEGKHKGRLVIPANHSDEHGVYRSHSLYSDDKGQTWKIGAVAEEGSNESQIAEVSPGILIQNMRMQTHSKGFRGTRTSKDGGATWTPLTHDENLPCPRCQASLIASPFDATMYFSNPAIMPRARKGMAIRTSLDGGKTWPYKKTIFTGPSGYSNLVAISRDRIGILYEAGLNDLAEGIAFRSFDKKELLQKEEEQNTK